MTDDDEIRGEGENLLSAMEQDNPVRAVKMAMQCGRRLGVAEGTALGSVFVSTIALVISAVRWALGDPWWPIVVWSFLGALFVISGARRRMISDMLSGPDAVESKPRRE